MNGITKLVVFSLVAPICMQFPCIQLENVPLNSPNLVYFEATAETGQDSATTIDVEKPSVAKSLAGYVKDAGDTPMSEVLVELFDNKWNKKLRTVTTNSLGYFSFIESRRGIYFIQFSKKGFAKMRLKVKLRRDAKVNILNLKMEGDL